MSANAPAKHQFKHEICNKPYRLPTDHDFQAVMTIARDADGKVIWVDDKPVITGIIYRCACGLTSKPGRVFPEGICDAKVRN